MNQPMTHPQRRTQQRQVILEELQKLRSHPTAAGLYAIVRQRLPKISLGTVYRNLELLVQAGVAQKLDVCGGEARFDGDVRRHDHVRCLGCGRVDDIHGPALDLLGGAANDFGGYQIVGQRVEFLGLCPACQDQRIRTGADDGTAQPDGAADGRTQPHSNTQRKD
jgi:Fur family transcriptional regulator, ferric uptake regulator